MTTFNHDLIQYVAHNDFGARIGLAASVTSCRQELIANIVAGELGFENLVAVQAFNAAEGWAMDITLDIDCDVAVARQAIQDREDFPLSRFTQQAAE